MRFIANFFAEAAGRYFHSNGGILQLKPAKFEHEHDYEHEQEKTAEIRCQNLGTVANWLPVRARSSTG